MLMFEAIDALKSVQPLLREDVSLFSSQQKPELQLLLRSVMMELRSIEAYRPLLVAQGKRLATGAIELLEGVGKVYEQVAALVLNRLACIVPGSLEGLYPRLIAYQFGATYGSIFRQADPATRDQLIALYEQMGENAMSDRGQLLSALAWIGDTVVQGYFQRWQKNSRQKLVSRSLLEQAMCEAGWELTEDGRRRDLYYHTCLALVPKEDEHLEARDIVKVIVPQEERCGGCGRHLITIFDINLQAEAMAFLEWQGQRVRIAMCPTCTSLGEWVFMDIDEYGRAAWSLDNGEEPVEPLEELDDWEDLPQLPTEALVCGPSRRTAYETCGAYQQEGLSQIGGFPAWVQQADYPHCPSCQQRMMFVGQISLMDVVENGEGMIYAFLCKECGKAATGYQQT